LLLRIATNWLLLRIAAHRLLLRVAAHHWLLRLECNSSAHLSASNLAISVY
jgi:hypothetical protein